MRKTRFQQLHLLISIIAAAALTVTCIIIKEGLFNLALWVSLAIIGFYILGQIIRLYLKSKVFPEPEPEPAKESEEEDLALLMAEPDMDTEAGMDMDLTDAGTDMDMDMDMVMTDAEPDFEPEPVFTFAEEND